MCPRNKFLQPFLHLAVRSGDGLVISYLIRSGDSFEALDLGDEGFCPSPGFFGTAIGDDALSGEALGRYAYHYSGDSGWWFTCNCVGDSFFLSVASLSVDLGVPAMLAATTPMSSGGVMTNGHVLRREGRWLRVATSACIFSYLWCDACLSRGSSIRR